MENELFDFAESDELAGFRLHRLEVYNWGTFHRRVWTMNPEGKNALLTGDIGSGKSTLVDAITTLLVPPQRVSYNKAAGADARERSLRSYVLGYYKSERSDESRGVKPVGLRDHSSYSVLLAHFHNAGYHQDVTLAQVIWFRDFESPTRIYVVAKRPLSITEDFADFGSDMTDLRKRLRRDSAIQLYENFRQYAADFRRVFGIESAQALDLFHQTVSMKSVGNLTDFVREHMLEAFPIGDRIKELIQHFEDLDRSHSAVLKAKEQIQALEPMVSDLDRYYKTSKDVAELKTCREALRPWFAQIKAKLLHERIDKINSDLERINARIDRLSRRYDEEVSQRDRLKVAISQSGGDRLDRLNEQIRDLEKEADDKRVKSESYHELASKLGMEKVVNDDAFLTNRRLLDQQFDAVKVQLADSENVIQEAAVDVRQLLNEYNEVTKEIESLRSRESNIPSHILEIRNRLAAAIGAEADEIPFVGELIQIRESEVAWEGAVERLLHNFGLSLLVPDRFYGAVAEWVDRTYLRGRVVYFRVPQQVGDSSYDIAGLDSESLVHKLDLRLESEFYPWLERELVRRFNYICCDDLDRFRRESRAITKAGQIKGGGRHEKDDRRAIGDRSRYVLGWSNEAKIKVLEAEADSLSQRSRKINHEISRAKSDKERLDERRLDIVRLQGFDTFEAIDWQSVELRRQQLIQERATLAASSNELRTLQEKLERLEAQLVLIRKEQKDAQFQQGAKETQRKQSLESLTEVEEMLKATSSDLKVSYFPRLDTMRPEALGDVNLTLESCENCQSTMREWLQRKIDVQEKRLHRVRDRIIDAMRTYKTRWPMESQEVDVNIEAGDEYRAMWQRLMDDDLPRFEDRFKTLLRENTIREIATFHEQLRQEERKIRERIDTINQSLKQIDYNTGRYIELLADPTHDAEIREFRTGLRACTDGALTGSEDDQYSEAKFLEVKAIIERFKGREGLSDLDRRWTEKVTDVRNWFYFSASERWREDESEHEHYTDSGGKSGGQKEKLAYTVLAASLAYQFGLEWGATRSKSFRFVVIDEAFGRGSDESARYGLELFERLNLQVLVVTPLQKIHVIEPFVSNVSFVHNDGGRDSKLRNLTIEEYRTEKAVRNSIRVS